MKHSDFHDKTLAECVTDEVWSDSIEAHLDKIREWAEKDYNDDTHTGNPKETVESLEVLLAIARIDQYLDDVYYAQKGTP